MIKKIYIICLLVLTASCSNLNTKNSMDISKMNSQLINQLESIQKDLKMNDFTSLKQSSSLSLFQTYKMKKLLEYDLSEINFYFSKPIINNNFAKNIIFIGLGENNFYFDVKYKYSNEEWKIIDFVERRREYAQ